jgi:hypothetical protein
MEAIVLQNTTEGLYVEAYGLGNVRQRHSAIDQLARSPHLRRVRCSNVNAMLDGDQGYRGDMQAVARGNLAPRHLARLYKRDDLRVTLSRN